jgi:hypothetical protein
MRFQLAKMRLTIRLARSPPASKRLAHVEPFLMSNGLSDLPLLASRKANSRHGSNWFAPTKSAIPPQTAGANIPAHVGQFFETRSACLRRFVGGTFPFAKTHKHLDTRLSEPARVTSPPDYRRPDPLMRVPLTGTTVAGRCRASFPGRTPELRAEILRQPAALNGLHQIGDGVAMRLL